jgi:hypothetical protein
MASNWEGGDAKWQSEGNRDEFPFDIANIYK